MKAVCYVISLPNRVDRRNNINKRFSTIDHQFEFVDAVSGEDLKTFDAKFCAPIKVRANWESHVKCFKKFIQSDAEIALIFEDDVVLSEEFKEFYSNLKNSKMISWDIFQFGYLGSNNQFKSLYDLQKKIIKSFLKTILLITFIRKTHFLNFSKRVQKKVLGLESIEETSKMLKLPNLIRKGFVSGTHAYAISRTCAESLLSYNVPTVMGADLALQILSMAPNWHIFRPAKSLASQDDSVVSIGEHSIYMQDFEELRSKGSHENWY